jgi:uncharacterized protein
VTGPSEQVRRDLRIPTAAAGLTLSADLYLPTRPEPAPALVTVLPYRKDLPNRTVVESLRWFARHGYAGVLVDHAGTGASDGVPHPPWSPGEADDAVTAVEWVANQPWCTGAVGLWGISHGGFTTLATATRRPPALKAVMPMMNALDAERDLLHPAGARGDLVRLASWGGMMLLQQLLPPLLDHTAPEHQKRWQERLHDIEPLLAGLARLGPGDPAFCVGGWQDMYREAVPQAYERIRAPKKLLMGPWGHTMPHESPFARLDFLPLALRWWDHWLKDIDTGLLDEPPVTLYIGGSGPGWASYRSWPPREHDQTFTLGGNASLVEPAQAPAAVPALEYRPDPTTGVLSGLAGIGYGSLARPVDQHDDDLRAVSVTSAPLPAAVLVAGRPEVTVRTAEGSPMPQRIVVRLADVDPDGRSTAITAGLRCPGGTPVTLAPAAYRVAAGHRIRVVVSDADFPRLVPPAAPAVLRIAGIELRLPVVPEHAGTPVCLPMLEAAGTRGGRWTITRDLLHDGIDITVGVAGAVPTVAGHLVESSIELRAAVRRARPSGAVTTGAHRATVHLSTGETCLVTVEVRCSHESVQASGEVTVDGATVCSRAWRFPLAPA